MSENYDYPPASGRPYHTSASDRTQQGRQVNHLRNLRNFLSERARGNESSTSTHGLETLIQEVEQSRLDRTRDRSTFEQDQDYAVTGSTDNTQQRGLGRSSFAPGNTSDLMDQESDAATNARPRSRWLRRSDTPVSLLSNNLNSLSDDLPGIEEIASRIREANATISSVLGDAFPRSESPMQIPLLSFAGSPAYPEPPYRSPGFGEIHHRSDSASDLEDRWRAKRRKLDSDDHREGFRGFSYGHYGQVVPGLLKMEIASCDGGNYYDDNGASSCPGNVLLDDSSVYCTKKGNCNLILKHHGDTPFSLRRIVIRAPKKGFDAAVQEGMVFVSMTFDELLENTAQYQIHYASDSRPNHRSRRQYAQPSQEYLNAYRAPLQTIDRSGTGFATQNESQEAGGMNSRAPLAPPSNIEPQFRVTTDNTNTDDDILEGAPDNQENDDSSSEPPLMFFNEDGELLCPEDYADNNFNNESDESNSELPPAFTRGRFRLIRRIRSIRNQHNSSGSLHRSRLSAPSRIEPVPSQTRGGAEVLKPHARFFIERGQSMVNIKFDPPPAGRFVLVKLWSPYSGGNIDIESIMLHGYAGTRYFASLDVR